MTFRRGQLKEARARSTVPPPPALEAALARTAANTAPRIPAGLVPGRNAALASSASGPRAAASARTHPRRPGGRSLSRGRPGRAALTCTASRSAAQRAPEAAAELGSAGESPAPVVREAPRRERQKDESDGRRRSRGGRRRRKTRSAPLSGDPPSSWPRCSSRRRSLPGHWEAGRGRLGPTSVRERRGASWGPRPENNGREGAGRRASALCGRSAGCAALGTAPAPLPASGEVESPAGGPGAAGRFPDLGVGAAPPLSLFWGRGGGCRGRRESRGRHLAPGAEAALSRRRRVPRRRGRRGSSRAESLRRLGHPLPRPERLGDRGPLGNAPRRRRRGPGRRGSGVPRGAATTRRPHRVFWWLQLEVVPLSRLLYLDPSSGLK